MYSQVIFEKKGRVAHLRLNRPDINNVVTGEKIISEIEMAVESVNTDRNISVLVVSAEGKVFSAGGDLNSMKEKKGMFSGQPEELFENYQKNVQRIPKAFFSLEVPSIAAVNGPASGAGCDLAFMCDIRVASKKAWFSQAFVNVGLISGDGGMFFLQKVANYPLIAEMVFTGSRISADRAYECGLVNKIIEDGNVEEKAFEVAEDIASKPPLTIRLAKKLLSCSYNCDLDDVLYKSALTQSLCHNTKDHKEAVNAFLEKRKPNFLGE